MNNGHSIVCMSSVNVRATWRSLRSVLLVLSIGFVDCSNTTAGSPDGAASPTDMPDGAASPMDVPDGAASPMVVGTFGIYDATSQTPVSGATVAYGNQRKTTDIAGEAKLDLPPGLPFEVIATTTSYQPIHFYGITASANFGMGRALFTDAQLSQLAGALGTTYDPNKAIISVNAAGADLAPLPQSITVDTSVAYGYALVPDQASPSGFKKSNATVAGGVSQVFLVNVTPGAVPLKVTPPSGMSCTVHPSSQPQGTEAVVGYAHAISTISLICK